MSLERQFIDPPEPTFQAVSSVIQWLEKPRHADAFNGQIHFTTRTSGWSWGSQWRIDITPSSTGSVARATMISGGSMVAGFTEVKRIVRIWDESEAALKQMRPPDLRAPIEVPQAELTKALDDGFPTKHVELLEPILLALAEAQMAASTSDVVREEQAVMQARRVAASAGVLAMRPRQWVDSHINRLVERGLLRIGVRPLGRVGHNLVVMTDRILQGEVAHALDEKVQASVEVGGQVLQSTRPTLTRMAAGSVLPGSALLVGLAVPKTRTTDMRTASFVVTHPNWRLVEPIDPDGAHEVTGLAGQINARAGEAAAASALSTPTTPGPVSVADELAKLAALRDAGALSESEFSSAKARLLGS